MITKEEVIRRGVLQMLEVNAAERRSLLKMIGIKPTQNDLKTAVELLADIKGQSDAQPRKVKKTKSKKSNKGYWTPARLAMVAKRKKEAKAREAEA